jgi:hypothetical protein
VWFKVDDKLHSHRKTRGVRRSHPTKKRDAAPFGLWSLAGSWCGDHGTGGFVPLEVLEEWDDDAEELAARLVAAGLWHHATADGEIGYVFNDWTEQNPDNAGAYAAHVRWHVRRKMVDPSCEHCPTEPDSTDEPPAESGQVENPHNHAENAPAYAPHYGSNALGICPTMPDPNPTRPDPTRPEDTSSRKRSDGSRPERFEEFWDTYAHKVGRKKAESAYRSALKKPGVTADLLIAAAAAYIDWQRREGKHPQFTKHPATWLNGEHWNDERVTREQPQTRTGAWLTLARDLHEAEQPTIPQIGEGQ